MTQVSSSQHGFTLIELLVVFSVMVILSSVGFASFSTFGHSQAVDVSSKDFKEMLYTARSRALSQLRDSACFSNGFTGQGYELKGYQVVSCCTSGACIQRCTDTKDKYELQAVYGYADGSGTTTQTCTGKKFSDPNISFKTTSPTTATYFFFASITGAVSTDASTGVAPQISITGYGYTKTTSVSQSGVMQ